MQFLLGQLNPIAFEIGAWYQLLGTVSLLHLLCYWQSF